VGTVIQHGDGDDLIEEELVRLVELGSEPIIDHVDELRQRHRLWPNQAAADLGRPVERPRRADLFD